MNSPFFSIVIPTYNRADFIEQTVRSVLRQTFADFEVIVVDDGSTDETASVVRSIDDERVTYQPKANEERAVARNTGTKLAKGKYVTFFDSDDLMYEDHLADAIEVIGRYGEPEFFHLGYEFVDAESGEKQKVDYLPEIANHRLIEGNHLSCRGVFLRRDIAETHPFNPVRDLSGTEDYELWLRLASRYPLYCDNRVTSAIVQHDARSVMNTDRDKLVRRISILEESLLSDSAFVDSFRDRIPAFKANNRIYIALHLALSKSDRFGAISFLFRSISHSPQALRNRAFYGTIKRLFI